MTDLDPYSLMHEAAAGSIGAQRKLADISTQIALNPVEGIDPYTTLIEGMVFARLAATQGAVEDQRRCIQMAGFLQMLGGGDETLAEAIARVELLADAGCEDAATFLSSLDPQMPAEILILAKAYVARLQKYEEAAI